MRVMVITFHVRIRTFAASERQPDVARDFGDEVNSDLVLNTQSFELPFLGTSLPEIHCPGVVFTGDGQLSDP